MNAFEIRNLQKSFKSNFFFKKFEILKNINISVKKGEIYGFLGPNGAGKTTTIKCALGLLKPDKGTTTIFAEPSNTVNGRRKVGFLPEHPYFYDYLTAEELLRFSGMLFNIPAEELKKKTSALLNTVGLTDKGKIILRKFSKGMIQRIGLAQALIHDPDLMILDEPFSGLDPIGRKEFRDIIISLKNSGKTIFFSSHILQDMEMIVDRVGIILHGKMVQEGQLSELISESVKYNEIVVRGISEEKLTAKNLIFLKKDQKYNIRMDSNKDINSIIKYLMDNNGSIISVTPVKLTLEDIFLKEIRA